MWKCNKCGGKKVSQEWSVFRPMNDPDAEIWDDWALFRTIKNLLWWQTVDSYWCDDCDDECTPIGDVAQ